MRERSSTYETITPFGMSIWRGATYMRKRRGEIGDPWGVPTETGAGVFGEPVTTRVHVLSARNEETQSTW